MDRMPLSKRAKDLLKVMGLSEDNPEEIERIFSRSRAEFLRHGGFGARTVGEIEALLIHHRLRVPPTTDGYFRFIPSGFSDVVDQAIADRNAAKAAKAAKSLDRLMAKLNDDLAAMIRQRDALNAKIEATKRKIDQVK